jgi:hypothetical protein
VGTSPEGITFDTGIFSTAVREGGVDLAGEGFDSLADTVLPKDNLVLFARGTSSSSSELLKKSAQLAYKAIENKSKKGYRCSQVQVIFSSEKPCRTFLGR